MDQLYKDINEIEDAVNGQHGDDQAAIAQTGLSVVLTLLRKNRDYGSTASRVPELAPKVSPETAIRVRLSDKVARIRNLLGNKSTATYETLGDTFLDLAGYSILEVVALGTESHVSIAGFIEDAIAASKSQQLKAELLDQMCVQFSILDGSLTPSQCLLKLREEMDAVRAASNFPGG